LLYYFRKSFTVPSFKFKEILNDVLWSFIIFIIIFLYQSYFFFDFNNATIKSLFVDTYWYSAIGDSQHIWGAENTFPDMNYFFPEWASQVVPYHYPEFWMSSFFSSLLQNSTFYSYYFVVGSLLTSIFLIGILGFFNKVYKSKTKILALSFLLLFSSGITFSFYEKFAYFHYAHTSADISIMGLFGKRYIFIYPFLLLGMYLTYYKKEPLNFIVFALTPVFSIELLPGVWGGLLLYQIILLIVKKFKRQNIFILLIVLIEIFLFILYYSIFKSSYSSAFTLRFPFEKLYSNGVICFVQLKSFFGNIVVYIILSIVLFFHIFLMLFLCFKDQKRILLLLICMVGCGIIASSFYLGITDGSQFANDSFILFSVALIAGMHSLLNDGRELKSRGRQILKLFLLLLFLYSLIWTFQRKIIGTYFYKEDKEMITKISNSIHGEIVPILIFLNEEQYSINGYDYWPTYNDLFMLKQLSDKQIIFTAGNPELFLKKGTLSQTGELYYYILTPLNEWRHKGKDFTLQTFIEHYKLKYFYFKEGVDIPDYIIKNADCIIRSEKTKNTFYRIK